MKAYFQLNSTNDIVTHFNGFAMGANGVMAADLPVVFPQWFAIGKDSNGIDQLQCSKYNGNPLVLTVTDGTTTYTATSIRLVGGHPIHRPR